MLVCGSRIIKDLNEEIVIDYSKKEIIDKFIEESVELIHELLDNNKGKLNYEKVIEEVADVQLMLWQVMYSYKIIDKSFIEKVNKVMYFKVGRTKDRYDKGEL